MAEIKINVSELSGKDSEKVKELNEFLEARLGVDITVKENVITISDEALSKKYLRVLIRKFLHKSDLKERFRPISNKENIIIKRRKKREE